MDTNRITQRANEVDSENNVRQLAIRTHGALISYFDGNDVTGSIKSRSNDVCRGFILALEGRESSELGKYRSVTGDELDIALERAYRQAGFENSNSELFLPARGSYKALPSGSVGPFLPGILALLETEYGIDSTNAVAQYKPKAMETLNSPKSKPRQSAPSLSEWEDAVRNAPGFESDAAAYIYVLEVTRFSDSSTWYYVGKSEGGFTQLISRTRSHTNNFDNQRVIRHDGHEILRGDYNGSMKKPGQTHQVVRPERMVSISRDLLDSFENEHAARCHIREMERRTAYEVALEYETTNVLGGKWPALIGLYYSTSLVEENNVVAVDDLYQYATDVRPFSTHDPETVFPSEWAFVELSESSFSRDWMNTPV